MKKILSIIIGVFILISTSSVFAFRLNPPKTPSFPIFNTVNIIPEFNIAGIAKTVIITITTNNAANGKVISAELIDGREIAAVGGVGISTGVIKKNKATLYLFIPAGIPSGNYKFRIGIASANYYNTRAFVIKPGARPVIASVALSAEVQTTGTANTVIIDINTLNIADASPVSIDMTDKNGNTVNEVQAATGSIINNSVRLQLVIPKTTKAGNYVIRINAAGATDSTAVYTVKPKTSSPIISDISVSAASQTAGAYKKADVIINTCNITDKSRSDVTVSLINSSGKLVLNTSKVKGVIKNNTCTVSVVIPVSTGTGSYKFKVEVKGITDADTSATYTINKAIALKITKITGSVAITATGKAKEAMVYIPEKDIVTQEIIVTADAIKKITGGNATLVIMGPVVTLHIPPAVLKKYIASTLTFSIKNVFGPELADLLNKLSANSLRYKTAIVDFSLTEIKDKVKKSITDIGNAITISFSLPDSTGNIEDLSICRYSEKTKKWAKADYIYNTLIKMFEINTAALAKYTVVSK